MSSMKIRSAINFTKYSVFLLFCWPPARNASEREKLIFNLSWWLMLISAFGLLLPLANSVYVYRDDSVVMTKSICLTCAVSQCIIKSVFCQIRRAKLQKLLEGISEFEENASRWEEKILEKYIERCTFLHVGVAMWTYFTSISFIIVPFLIAQPFPTDAVYPFSVDNTFVRIIIYVHQSLVAFQVASAVLLDCLVAFILWFVSARFEIMSLLISDYQNFGELKGHIIQYQKLLRYTNDVKSTINLFVFSTLATSGGGVLFGTIQLVGDQPLAVKAQYLIVAVAAVISLFVCSWASDTVLQMEYVIGQKAFHSNWMFMEKKTQTCVLHLIIQSQNPVKIRANSIFPVLSLSFFSQFLLTSFKFFASLRIMVSL